MSKREKDINGNYIGNAIGVCHCDRHPGALNRQIAYKHKCLAKKCKYLEKYNEESNIFVDGADGSPYYGNGCTGK